MGHPADVPGPTSPDGSSGATPGSHAGDGNTTVPPGVRAGDVDPGETVPGVGPHPHPWPEDPRLDPELLAGGDRRNVVDRYRYWRLEAVAADLRARSAPLHVAIENLAHDFNIGSVVRTANAFNVGGVHVVGRRRWNRRGAMVTDRYLDVHHHPTAADLAEWAAASGHVLVGVDNPPGATALETTRLPERCCLVFGAEGPGLSPELLDVCSSVVAITQHGSTRSINVGAAAAIAMYHWSTQWPRPASCGPNPSPP